MLPAFLEAAKLLDENRFEIMISKASTVFHSLFMHICESSGLPRLHIVDGYRYEMMKYADYLVSTSGTATLEAAFIGTPLTICYKAAPISYLIGRKLVRIKRIGLPNIVLDKDLLPELIQKDCNPRNIVKTVLETLDNPDKINLIKKELSQLKALLGDRKTSIEMLNLVKKMLETYA